MCGRKLQKRGKICNKIGFISAIISLTLLTEFTVSYLKNLRGRPFQKSIVDDRNSAKKWSKFIKSSTYTFKEISVIVVYKVSTIVTVKALLSQIDFSVWYIFI